MAESSTTDFQLNAHDLNATKSRIELNPDGSDTSLLQAEANGLANIDTENRLDTLSKSVDSVAEYFRNTTVPPFITELNGKQIFNPEVADKLVTGLNALKTIRNADKERADKHYRDIAYAIIENSSINAWQEELLAEVRKRMK